VDVVHWSILKVNMLRGFYYCWGIDSETEQEFSMFDAGTWWLKRGSWQKFKAVARKTFDLLYNKSRSRQRGF
jgi:hypothetical protein